MFLRLHSNKIDRRQLSVFAAEQNTIPRSLRSTALRDQQKILKEKIQNWQSVQTIYMPGLLQIQTELDMVPAALWNANINPEDIKLWLPSRILAN